MKRLVLAMELGTCTMGLAKDQGGENEGKPIKSSVNRSFGARMLYDAPTIVTVCLAAMLTLAPMACAFGQTFYNMTMHNNFGTGEFYNATPTDAQIWLLTNFKFSYLSSGNWIDGNATAGSYASVRLSEIDQGKIRLYRTNGGTRIYAVLSDTQPPAAQLNPSTSQPYSYFEWSFDGSGGPGTLDLSWIDRWDFLTRLEVSNLPSSAPTMVYGAKQGQSTSVVGAAMASYASQSQYAWLGSGAGGFSKELSFPGASNPIGWVTQNQSSGSGFAAGIGSFTHVLDLIISTAAASPTWPGLTSGVGLNWTTAGFRIGLPQTMKDPATGTVTGKAWTAYVGFVKDSSGLYTMQLTDFTLYDDVANANVLWSAVNNDSGAVYEVTQAEGALDCIWTSSWNNLVSDPSWVTNLGSNGPNVLYALYNALASGVIYKDEFVNTTALPTTGVWVGYVPRITDISAYNFEILSTGAMVINNGTNQGLGGLLTGQDMIDLLDNRLQDNALMNPYMLELLRTQEVTPAYLYPSQDVWAFNGIASDPPVLGLQTGPLNGQSAFGDDATFDWYLGGGGLRSRVGSMTGSLMLLLLKKDQ